MRTCIINFYMYIHTLLLKLSQVSENQIPTIERLKCENKVLHLLLGNKIKRETLGEYMGEYFLVFQDFCFWIIKMHLDCVSVS